MTNSYDLAVANFRISTLRLTTLVVAGVVWSALLWGRTYADKVPMPVMALAMAVMRDIPLDLMDAARMDGASEIRVFWQIVVPLIRPALATVAVFNMIPIYNDLWFPLILTRAEESRTVTYGVSLLFGQYQTDWNAILSTLSLAAVPILILYLLMSKQFIRGLTAGAIKG